VGKFVCREISLLTYKAINSILRVYMSLATEIAVEGLIRQTQESSLRAIMHQESFRQFDELSLGRLFTFGQGKGTSLNLAYALPANLEKTRHAVMTSSGSILLMEASSQPTQRRNYGLIINPFSKPFPLDTQDPDMIYRYFEIGMNCDARLVLTSRNMEDMEGIKHLIPQSIAVAYELQAQREALLDESSNLIFDAARLAREKVL
jgi:hypothetical protein